MTNNFDDFSTMYETVDIFSCYEPIETPPPELIEEWNSRHLDDGPEPTLENTSFYVTMPDGTKYFYCGNTRIKVSEHFADKGKTMPHLIESVVRYAAGNERNLTPNPIY